jgi:hypothetical protein
MVKRFIADTPEDTSAAEVIIADDIAAGLLK